MKKTKNKENPLKRLYDWITDRKENETLDTTSPNILKRGEAILKSCIKDYINKQMKVITNEVSYELKKGYYDYINTDYKYNNQGLKSYKLNDLKKSMRKELTTRTGYALTLIKTQTEQNLNKLRSRFIDWINNQTLNNDKQTLKQTLKLETITKQNKRHTDFILRDQYMKMIGNFDSIIGKHYEAIGFIWKNRKDKRVAGNPAGLYPKVNPNSKMHGNHWERENKFYLYKNNWALKNNLVKKVKDYSEEDLKDGTPSMPIGCRCYRINIYELNEVPKEYLTDKGIKYVENMQ